MIFLRLGLFLAFVTFTSVGLYFWVKLAGEVDDRVPPGTGPFSSLTGLGSPGGARTMKQHRALYPRSNLRRKVGFWQVAAIVSALMFLWSWR